jgi:hypothetical protein
VLTLPQGKSGDWIRGRYPLRLAGFNVRSFLQNSELIPVEHLSGNFPTRTKKELETKSSRRHHEK